MVFIWLGVGWPMVTPSAQKLLEWRASAAVWRPRKKRRPRWPARTRHKSLSEKQHPCPGRGSSTSTKMMKIKPKHMLYMLHAVFFSQSTYICWTCQGPSSLEIQVIFGHFILFMPSQLAKPAKSHDFRHWPHDPSHPCQPADADDSQHPQEGGVDDIDIGVLQSFKMPRNVKKSRGKSIWGC